MFITNLKQAVNAFLNGQGDAVLKPEVPKSELHASMHSLIQRHKELIARIKENHNLLQSMKQSEGMGRQKEYVWQEIQADRKLATSIADEIKAIKVTVYGDRATNI